MDAGRDPRAAAAGPAVAQEPVLGGDAQQRLREPQRERLLPDPRRPGEEVAVGQRLGLEMGEERARPGGADDVEGRSWLRRRRRPPFGDDRPGARRDRIGRGGRVEDDDAAGEAAGELEVPVPDAGVEGQILALEPVARLPLLGPARARAPARCRAGTSGRARCAASRPSTGRAASRCRARARSLGTRSSHRRNDRTASSSPARSAGRHDLGDELRARRVHQHRLRERIDHRRGVNKDPADQVSKGCAARFPGDENIHPARTADRRPMRRSGWTFRRLRSLRT